MRLSCLLASLTLLLLPAVQGASLLAIDYGTDSFKASLVKPGIPFDVLINKDSKRKTPSLVTLRGDERAFGGEAASLATRFPQDTFSSIKLLLGHPSNHSQASLHQSLFLPSLSTTPRMSTSVASSKSTYEVEELLAMQLSYAKEMAEEVAGEVVRDVVVTVPNWFGAGERLAMLDAIELAGLRSLGLVNDGTAAAVNFAMTRTFSPTPSFHLIYDFGAGSLRCTAVSLQSVLLPDPLSLAAKPDLKNVTSLAVHGVGFDAHVGGYVFDRVVRDLLKEAFTRDNPAAGATISGNKRAMAKLLREAGRVKQVLSANSESVARIEGLVDDVDFKTTISRKQLEAAAAQAGLIPRFIEPIAQALASANLSIDQIESIILIGGSSRVPMVEAAVRDLMGADKLAKNVNADEAAVMGAALYGAALARGFRTKDIRVQDIFPYALDVSYFADTVTPDEEARKVTTQLFPPMSKLGSKKTISVKKNRDFDMVFSYAPTEQHSLAELPAFISEGRISGISHAFVNLTSDAIANATIKVTVELSEDGLVAISHAAAILSADDTASASTLNDKLKDLLGKFGSGKPAPVGAAQEENSDDPQIDDVFANDSIPESRAKLEELLKSATPSNSTVKLSVTSRALDRYPLSSEEKVELRKRLREAKAAEARKLARAEAQNILEAYIYRVRDLVEQPVFVEASLESERKLLKERTQAASDWLYEEGGSAPTKDLKSKKSDLEKLVKHVTARSAEAEQRPRAVSALQTMLLAAETYATSARTNASIALQAGELARHTDVELDNLDQMAKATATWLQDLLKKQASLKAHEDPVLKVGDMEKKAKVLDAEVSKLRKKKAPRRHKGSSIEPSPSEPTNHVKDEL